MSREDTDTHLPHFEAAHRLFEAIEQEDGTPLVESDHAGDWPTFPGYAIDAVLGSGSGGTVYRAYRDGSASSGGDSRPLAIKHVRQRLGAGSRAQRCWRELQFLAELRLASLPHLHDYGEVDGRLFIVTDLIDGLPLDEYCHVNQLDLRSRVELLARTADAVAHLHEHGVIHRDLKPTNILVNPHGQPVIVDLGIAILLAEDVMQTLTEDGVPVGSPAYMAPEQARGERQAISTRSDVYGLGAMAYRVLTGNTPHDMDASLYEVIRRVGQEQPRDPRTLRSDLPRPLAAVLSKAVAFDAAKRYASATGLAEDLRRWLRGEPVTATEPSIFVRTCRWVARHPIISTSAACIAVAAAILAGTLISVWWVNQQPYAVTVDTENRAWVRLITRSGNILHEWQAQRVESAALLDRPDHLGGGRIIVINRYYGLEVYDMHAPTAPAWSVSVLAEEFNTPLVPKSPDFFRGTSFHVRHAMAANFFPERPGMELAVLHQHDTYSPVLLRIYDLAGEVLFEAWHNGHLYDTYWLSTSGLLVLSGVDSNAPWPARGEHEVYERWPLVVFAIRPELGRVATQPDLPWDAWTVTPIWHRTLLPAISSDIFSVARLRSPTMAFDSRTHFHCDFQGTERWESPAIRFVLDDEGNTVRYIIDDRYRKRTDLPAPSIFHLGDLPPRVE